MAISFSAPRTVLLLGTDGVSVFSVAGKNINSLRFISWNQPDFVAVLSNCLVVDGKKKAVLVLYDMEQNYKLEWIAKASVLDQTKMIQRSLNVAYPQFNIKSYLPLKNVKPPKDVNSDGDEGGFVRKPYLFAAMPDSAQLGRINEAILDSMVNVAGMALLPAESASLVAKLSAAKFGSGKVMKSRWAILISQQKSGGLRQIIIRDGELALTRITHLSQDNLTSQGWAREVAQEFKTSMTYLARFGYTAEDGLDVIVVADKAAGEAIKGLISVATNLEAVTPSDAIRLIGGLSPESEGGGDRYADILHAFWSGQKRSFDMPMKSPELVKISQWRMIAQAVAVVLFLAIGPLIFKLFTDSGSANELKEELSFQESRVAQAQLEYDETVKAFKTVDNADLLENSVKVYEDIERNSINPLPIFYAIGKSQGSSYNIAEIKIGDTDSAEGGSDDASAGMDMGAMAGGIVQGMQDAVSSVFAPDGSASSVQEELPKVNTRTVLKLSFPDLSDTQEGVRVTNTMHKKFVMNLPGYDVEIVKQVADLSFTGNFSGTAGTSSGDSMMMGGGADQEMTAEIEIAGESP